MRGSDLSRVYVTHCLDRFCACVYYASASMTSVYHQEPAGFNLVLSACFFFTLKGMGPIHCHYMTDRLQRFELNILVCVVLVTYILDALIL